MLKEVWCGNKGEWSESYTFLKLLGTKKLSVISTIDKSEVAVYPILSVGTMRRGSLEIINHVIRNDEVVVGEEADISRRSVLEFQKNAEILLERIKSSDGNFSVPGVQDFLESVRYSSFKASSRSKKDIVVGLQGMNREPLGFSIKSRLGSPPTLVNASRATNFIFQVKNLPDCEIGRINSERRIKDRVGSVLSLGGEFEFVRVESSIFLNNLVLIDSRLPEILSKLVYEYYLGNSDSKISSLVETITNKNPLNYDNDASQEVYKYKVKRFLIEVTLGLVPSVIWTGRRDAAGCLFVKTDGEILCYSSYDRVAFESYLFDNLKLETGSTSRHSFGSLYKGDGGSTFVNFNLQIRFI